MQQFELNAELRTDTGKGASRRLRRTGKVPGILYGTEKEAVSIQLDHDDLVHHLDSEAFYSHILKLKIGKNSEEVVLRDLQRHPYKPKLLHIDLQRIMASEEISMRVPIHILNETTSPGVKDERGIVNSLMTQLEVYCLPKNLPEYIEIDIGEMHVGDSIHLSDIKLPEGVELEILASGGDPHQAVLSIQPPQVEEEEPEEGAEEAAPDVPTVDEADKKDQE
ncbi:MAG: 50S ribosomal protein L25/general stress protein Ctc [Gammaproteobacteria bacterium]